MANVTLQVLEGLERGNIFSSLETPFTIGREISNSVALNDESISRYHAKIQDDNGKVILTDLGSTNGTRVNGHPVQLRVLQTGDLIQIGRCILMYGTAQQIEAEFGSISIHREEHDSGVTTKQPFHFEELAQKEQESIEEREFGVELFPSGCPDVPKDLSLIQRAQVSDLLAFTHSRVVQLLSEGIEDYNEDDREVRVPWGVWQKIIKAEMELAQALQRIAEPE